MENGPKGHELMVGEKTENNSKFFQQMSRWMRQIVPLAIMLATSLPTKALKKDEMPIEKTAVTTILPQSESYLEPHIEKEKEKQWNIDYKLNFIDKETGEFNPLSILAPIQLEFGTETNHTEIEIAKIDHEYARWFAADQNARAPLNPADYPKLVEFVRQEKETEFASNFYGVDMSHKHPDLYWGQKGVENLTVQNLSVVGTTSPEGPQEKGPTTFSRENIDPENLALGRVRGEEGLTLIQEQLEKMGVKITPEITAEALKNLQSHEIQFTDDELKSLSELSGDFEGVTTNEKIFDMIVKYNNGQIDNPEITTALNQIIAQKRGVEIAIDYTGKQREKVIIPLPLLLLLLPFVFRRRKTQLPPEEGTPPTETVPEETPVTPLESAPKSWKKYGKTELPPEEELEKMRRVAIIEDLYPFMGYPRTIKRGLDYRRMAVHIDAFYDTFDTAEHRELSLTEGILGAWRLHDMNCRREAGISESEIRKGLDYTEQPNQIVWARVHAQEIIKLVEERRQNHRTYEESLQARAVEMLGKTE